MADSALANKQIWAKMSECGINEFRIALFVATESGIVPDFSDASGKAHARCSSLYSPHPRECKFIDGVLCIFNNKTEEFTPIREVNNILCPDEYKIWEYRPSKTPEQSEDISLTPRDKSECDFSDYSGKNGVESLGYHIKRNKPLASGKV